MHDIAACFAVLNEGPQLEATIGTAVACKGGIRQVVVVDDGSRRPCGDRLAPWKHVSGLSIRYHDNGVNAGCGAARTTAVDLASADIVAVMDPHLRLPWEWAEDVTKAVNAYPDDIFCAVCTGFERTSGHKGYGARVVVGPSGFIEGKWLGEKDVTPPYPEVPCVYGGAYFGRRATFEAIGGFAPLLRGWGLDEEWLAVRAAITGRKCRVITSLVVPHLFRTDPDRTSREGGQLDERWTFPYNRAVIALAAFQDPSPWLAKIRHNPVSSEQVLASAGRVQRVRDLLNNSRTLGDGALYDCLGISPPG